jgi:hypothetical protein
MTGANLQPAPPGRAVAIWHRRPDGRARATALTQAASRLPHAALARLIAARVLGDADARVTIDHVVTLPPDTAVLPAGQAPLEVDEEALEDLSEQVPEVADPATGAVRVMARRCDSCIYRRATRRALGTSVPALITDARARGGFVVCHESLPAWQGDQIRIPASICAGYAAAFPDTFALRVARAIGHVELIDPPGAPDRRG